MAVSQRALFTRIDQDDTCPSVGVVTAVAEAEGVSPLDLQPPLGSVIDTDALDRLGEKLTSRPDQPPARIEFPYKGYLVTVTEDRGISLAELDSDTA